MATLNAGTGGPVRFDTVNIATWLTGAPAIATPTIFFVDGAGYRQFEGTGFTYGADGFFNGGTITSIYLSPPAGGTPHHFAGLSMPVATFNAYVDAGDTAGFLASIFAGNDTLQGNNSFAFNDYLDGYAGHDTLYGGLGNDTLRGGQGNDRLDGQGGIDKMDGGADSDSYYVDEELDIAADTGTTGIDTVFSTAYIYTLGSGIENFTLVAGGVAGHGNGLDNKMVGTSAGFEGLFGGEGKDKLYGNGGGEDYLDGEGGNDSLYGGSSYDFLIGGTGADRMQGYAGNDGYTVDDFGDVVIEAAGGGLDHVYSTISYKLGANVENLFLSTALDISGTGNTLDNYIEGNIGDNLLQGAQGNDTLYGGEGADRLLGGDGNDRYELFVDVGDVVDETGTTGIDTVETLFDFDLSTDAVGDVEHLELYGSLNNFGYGNGLANRIDGNLGNNVLAGRDGNDTLVGNDGNDYLYGGKGNDSLIGGEDTNNHIGNEGNDRINVGLGNDTVWYLSTLDGRDILQNFDGNAAGGQDKLNLDSLFDSLGVAVAGRAGRVQLIDRGASVDVKVDTNADGTFDLFAATVQTADVVSVGSDVIVS
jgi:Ca2+-binding RTX toxin-like protein